MGWLIAAIVLAGGAGLVWLLAGTSALAVPVHRRKPGYSGRKSQVLTDATRWVSEAMSRLVHGREAALIEQLSMASINIAPVDFLVWSLIASVILGALGALAGGFFGVLAGSLLAFGGVQAWVLFASARRRKKFDDQMLETLQTVSGALRAGNGLSAAIAMVAEESESPTAEEFSRAVNEARIGADLVTSMQAVADRTRSESMQWMVKTLAVNAEVGGSLADAIDGATETIRARVELTGQVRTLSAEGKLSAYILMALPIFVAVIVNLFTPGYMAPLVELWPGWIVLATSAVQFIIGGIWMRKIIKIKY
mgnify:CR=1 FL=1